MDEKALLEAMGAMMDARLKPIVDRLDRMQGDITELREDVAELKEAHEATRDGVNRLLEWADECGYIVKLPLPKI